MSERDRKTDERKKRKRQKREKERDTKRERKSESAAFPKSASSRVCRLHGSSPESQTACYKRMSKPITDHRKRKKDR